MEQNQLQELFQFVQATIQLNEEEIREKIKSELKDSLNNEQIENMIKQVLEIKKSITEGDIPS